MAILDRLYTVRDLETMPDDGKTYELHNGVLIDVAGSKAQQTWLAAWIIFLLMQFIEQHKLGGAVSGADGTFTLNDFNARISDVAYITAERVTQQDTGSYLMGAPDLAIEVVSPSNSAPEMQQRAGEYLSAGGELIRVSGEGILDGGDVLPGLVLPVSKVFEHMK
ncbi:MAG: Uma2 family endonuclease [Chloroflexota bacterium]